MRLQSPLGAFPNGNKKSEAEHRTKIFSLMMNEIILHLRSESIYRKYMRWGNKCSSHKFSILPQRIGQRNHKSDTCRELDQRIHSDTRIKESWESTSGS